MQCSVSIRLDAPCENHLLTIKPDTEPTSKSSQKREATRLQPLGKRLTELTPDQLQALELPDLLLHALGEHRRFSSREAKRRQLQFIGRIMREIDADEIVARLDELQGASAQSKRIHHQAEQWRERLLHDPDALTQFIVAYPKTNPQQMRQQLMKIHGQHDPKHLTRLRRELFRSIKLTLERA